MYKLTDVQMYIHSTPSLKNRICSSLFWCEWEKPHEFESNNACKKFRFLDAAKSPCEGRASQDPSTLKKYASAGACQVLYNYDQLASSKVYLL